MAIIRGEMVPMLVKRQVKEIIRTKDTSLYAHCDNQDDSMANFQQVSYTCLVYNQDDSMANFQQVSYTCLVYNRTSYLNNSCCR